MKKRIANNGKKYLPRRRLADVEMAAFGPDNPLRERARETLLRRATSSERAAFAFSLTSAPTPDKSMETLLRHWGDLAVGARRRVIATSPARLLAALSRLATAPDRGARRAAAMVARWTPLPEAIAAAGDLLTDREGIVADAAERTLVSLVEHAPGLRPRQREALVQTLVRGVSAYAAHRRRGVVAAAERLGPWCDPRMRAWLKGASDADLMPLRAAVRRATDPDAPRRRVKWLGEPTCAPAALDALRDTQDPDDRAGALSAAHLLHDAERRVRLSREPRAARLGEATVVPAASRRDTLRWRRMTAHREADTIRECVAAFLEPDPLLRVDALRMLQPIVARQGRAADALRDFAFDPEPAISRSAALSLAELSSDSQSVRTALDTLTRAAHEGTRRVAAEALAPPRAHERLIELRARMEEEPDLVVAQLRGRIREGRPDARCEAIGLARRLRLDTMMERDLLDALHDGHPRVAATAAGALGALETGGARAALSTALAHPDPRVRANAIEAVGRRDPVAVAVARAACDDHARTRANAIRARLALSPGASAVDQLESMLHDDRPAHRLSALWVAQRYPLAELGRRVEKLRDDPDARVRQRAARCMPQLAHAGGAPAFAAPSARQ